MDAKPKPQENTPAIIKRRETCSETRFLEDRKFKKEEKREGKNQFSVKKPSVKLNFIFIRKKLFLILLYT